MVLTFGWVDKLRPRRRWHSMALLLAGRGHDDRHSIEGGTEYTASAGVVPIADSVAESVGGKDGRVGRAMEPSSPPCYCFFGWKQ